MNIDYILNNSEKYKEMLSKRFKNPEIIEDLRKAKQEYLNDLIISENLNKDHNELSKLISSIKKNGLTDENKYKIINIFLNELDYTNEDIVFFVIDKIKSIQNKKNMMATETAKKLNNIKQIVSEIPNLLDLSVTISNTEDDNQTVFQTEICERKKYGQYELCLKAKIYESAIEIAGNRGYFLTGDGVKLNCALLLYAQDFITKRGYKLMQTPMFMTNESMKIVCQLSEFDETLYKLKDGESEDKYLIATSEQPLTAYFNKKKINNLPIRLCGISSCFRREAGKHGKDTNGMFRVHQFEKVEQFCVTDSQTSYEMMEEMLQNAKDFYDSLGIQYRVVSIVSGALNNAASKKYDIEGWFPGSGEFRELVSCSNTTDYFSRRLDTKDNHNQLCHMLNSTLYANTRTICCLMEMYQMDDYIKIPDVLIPYFGKEHITF